MDNTALELYPVCLLKAVYEPRGCCDPSILGTVGCTGAYSQPVSAGEGHHSGSRERFTPIMSSSQRSGASLRPDGSVTPRPQAYSRQRGAAGTAQQFHAVDESLDRTLSSSLAKSRSDSCARTLVALLPWV